MCLTVIAIGFLLADVAQRVIVAPLVRLAGDRRHRVLAVWKHMQAGFVFTILRITSGARLRIEGTVPAASGTLVVMNHQSLLDIPAVTRAISGGYARFVVRRRYARGIPLISHMVRLYRHFTIDPGRVDRRELDRLRDGARDSSVPIVIFPEGHRTRDGGVLRWKTKGLDAILSGRDWQVYVAVIDGVWRVGRLSDFVRNVVGVRGRLRVVGPYPFDPERDDIAAFGQRMRGVMCDTLAAMRDGNNKPVPTEAPTT